MAIGKLYSTLIFDFFNQAYIYNVEDQNILNLRKNESLIKMYYYVSDLPLFWLPIIFWMLGFVIYFSGLSFLHQISTYQYYALALITFLVGIGIGHNFEMQSKTASIYIIQFLWLILLNYLRLGLVISIYNNASLRSVYNYCYRTRRVKPTKTVEMTYFLLNKLYPIIERSLYGKTMEEAIRNI